jgi:hypothetical protein
MSGRLQGFYATTLAVLGVVMKERKTLYVTAKNSEIWDY